MDLDFAKFALLILAVMPGYFALRALKSVAPLSRQQKGATEELAEFLVYSACAHLILLPTLICACSIGEHFLKGHPFISPKLLMLSPSELADRAAHLPASVLLIYLPLSFLTGWGLGFARGLIESWHLLERLFRNLPARRFLFRWVGRFFLTQRPMIYDTLFPRLDANGASKLVFVEIVLRNNQGIYSGQLLAFSILRDEERNKLAYIIDAYFKASSSLPYAPVTGDGMLLDLSEALSVSVLQT
jgi:hypothetical protein